MPQCRPIPLPEDQPVITVEEAAEMLGISRGAAYNAVRSGEIPSVAFGRRKLVPTAPLRRMVGLDVGSPTPA